jgi:hypothetical protein
MVPWYQNKTCVWRLPGALIGICMAAVAPRAETSADVVPAWLFPMDPPGAATSAAIDVRARVHLPGSDLSFDTSQLTDLFYAPDWFPRMHGPMPDIVAHGRPREVYACGYCHSPSGQGRPGRRIS